MRLAVFTSQYPTRVASFFERDMRALCEAGVEIEVFAAHPHDDELWQYSLDILTAEQLPRDHVRHITLRDSLRPALRSAAHRPLDAVLDAGRVLGAAARYGPIPLAKTAYVLPKALAWADGHAHRFDHVLAYWGNYAGSCAWAFHRQIERDIPFSIWLHAGTDLYRSPVFLRQKLAYADNIITCCEFNRDFIRREFTGTESAAGGRIHVCHHGLDLVAFPWQPEGRATNRVIAVGRLAAHKGFRYLVEAVHALRTRGIDLTLEFVGDGPERPALAALAGGLGMGDHVRFAGWVPFPAARRAMAEATLLVHPSDGLGDGLPNVVREAMALGTPVIASDVAGIPDALGDGRGLLVPPCDTAALASAIERLLQDRAARHTMARRARRHVEEHFDLWNNGAALATLLRQTRRRRIIAAHVRGRTRQPGAQEGA